MERYLFIPIEQFCSSHQIEIQWIKSLEDYGLITVIYEKEELFVSEKELIKLERILTFYRDLEINLAGIETVFHLLERLENAQERVRYLENKLQKFE
ncbi:hypothetical protein AAU57_06710 [Nonlabens sp. YIK11]|uniref:chaperone modulator CbpM n=1 Tax=Nonlabens sp. YIK11 TaxID=1453349 RepID=UPI0006DC2EEA|nr:chaperone modulator CbpM [Nonlabens sp. YIK11]KQC33045.1 hypothetical protein AAU57_06710 [Nonlabens sp. YIK11]